MNNLRKSHKIILLIYLVGLLAICTYVPWRGEYLWISGSYHKYVSITVNYNWIWEHYALPSERNIRLVITGIDFSRLTTEIILWSALNGFSAVLSYIMPSNKEYYANLLKAEQK